ncbi:hypothetical protein Tco_0652839 [Tanacetum coccineum]|uniref:Uncharacterized protein n=1 Tax=Tanacetum coccineum TaxID=301880 RepID=A0ABQ4WZ54_9ASTR
MLMSVKKPTGVKETIDGTPTMVLDESCLNNEEFSLCLLGKVTEFASLTNLKVVLAKEGFGNIELKYMGGFWVMIVFQEEETMKAFHENKSYKDLVIRQGEGIDTEVTKRDQVVRILQDIEKTKAMEVAQKAKIKWAVEGDEHSKYYHGVINKKRNNLAIRESSQIKNCSEQALTLERRFQKREVKRAWDLLYRQSPSGGLTLGFIFLFWNLIDAMSSMLVKMRARGDSHSVYFGNILCTLCLAIGNGETRGLMRFQSEINILALEQFLMITCLPSSNSFTRGYGIGSISVPLFNSMVESVQTRLFMFLAV